MSITKHLTRTLTYLWLGINAFFALMFVVGAYIGYVHPENSSYAALLGLGYPIPMTITLLFIPFWLIFNKKLSLLSIASLLVAFPQFWSFSPLNVKSLFYEPSDKDFSVMTYNVFGMKDQTESEDGNATITEILKYDTDIACLQESPDEKALKRTANDSQWNLLEKRYPYRLFDKYNGVLSKTPIENVYQYEDDRYFILTVYQTKIDSTATFIVNTHLESIGLTADDKELYMELTSVKDKNKTLKGVRSQLMNKLKNAYTNRARQAEMIRGVIDSLAQAQPEANLILCGDFNDTSYGYAYLTICGDDLHDAYADAAFGPTHTYNANRFYFKIDHILYKGRLEARRTIRGNVKSSDHYPLITYFETKSKSK